MLFKVNFGDHRMIVGGKTTLYHTGDVIETDCPLDKKFPIMLNGMWKFQQIEEKAVDIRPTIATIKRSPSEVEGVPEQTPSPSSVVTSQVETIEEEEEAEDFGDDVTKEFSVAEDLDLKVFFDGTEYKIVSTQTNKVVNTKKLTKPKSVDNFLVKQAEM